MNGDREQYINQLGSIYLNRCCSYLTKHVLNPNAIALFALTSGFSLLGVSQAIAAIYTVTNSTDTLNTSDPNYVGSLRWAIEQAEANSDPDTIDINVGGTITVNNQDPDISQISAVCGTNLNYTPAAAFQLRHSLTINGNGAIIDGGRTGGADSLTGRRIFYVPDNTSAAIALNNITLQNGNGAVIENNSRRHIASGGGDGNPCSNGGIIWMEDSTINLDTVRVSGGLSNDGGAINIQSGTLNINDSTFDANFARDDGGVFDIDDLASVSILNSTITNNASGVNTNQTGQNGSTSGTGGIARVQGNFNLTYVTAAYNIAGGDAAFDIKSNSNFILRNNLFVANTLAGTNTVKHCDAIDFLNLQDNNWADTNDCGAEINVDTAANIQLSSNLASNSGITPTLALADTSSVNGIIGTTDNLCPDGVGIDDQRDVARAVNAGCEPGAYELQLPVPTDYGDAPDTYGDAVHNIPASPGLYLGSVAPDGEPVTRTENTAGTADGDDSDNTDDEDAFDSLIDVPTLGSYSLEVPLNSNLSTATLHAWVDFDRNGIFDELEHQSVTVEQNDTSASLNWAVPNGTTEGETYVRFRLTSDTAIDNTTPDGIATDGEVEDYPVTIKNPVSPLLGKVIINEVLFRQSGRGKQGNDEFIELYNTSDAPIDMSGWQLMDGNLLVNSTDGIGSIGGNGIPFILPSNTVLNSGEYAVVWVGEKTADKDATAAAYQFYLDRSPKLNNRGDDMWLYDPQTRIVDYVAYGSNNGNNQAINIPPDPALNLWDATYQDDLRKRIAAGQSISLTPDGQDGNTSACWEATTSEDADPRCTTYLLTRNTDRVDSRITSVGLNNNGARLALVKRVTALVPNRQGINFNTFIEDGIPNNEDNHPDWHSDKDTYLRGQIGGLEVQPGDEIEYTVYFLSNGGAAANEVKLCDVIPDHLTFVKNTYGVELGIGLGLNDSSLPTSPNFKLSNLLNDDLGDFYAPNTAPPKFCQKNDLQNPQNLTPVNASNNNAGAVVVELDSPLPYATDPGVPTNSYGFVRFRAKVK